MILVVDVGTSKVRAAAVDADGKIGCTHHLPVLGSTPAPGMVELDPAQLAEAALSVARSVIEEAGPPRAVGIANQRATTIVWDRTSGEPVQPGIGWQDLRTVGTCLSLGAQGISVAPNESATKLAWLLDEADPERSRDLCFGTVDTWVAWNLSGGTLHVTDATNAGVTGLLGPSGRDWDDRVLQALRIPSSMLPKVVDSSGMIGEACALPGAPAICGIAGDQQASLVGQGCTRPGLAKATFGTGGMLDLCTGAKRPSFARRGEGGTFPIVAWRRAGTYNWGVEAVMLSAGTCVEWLRDDLGVIEDAADSDALAKSCEPGGDVWFVPALLGLGAPVWDFGARGTVLGLTRGTGRAELVRAVLEGVAQRGADLVEAAETDTSMSLRSLRVDGGMTANHSFVQLLADATGIPIEVSPVLEATSLGAAYLAGMAIGIWRDEQDVADAWSPIRVVEPALSTTQRAARRERWYEARQRAERTIPELSSVSF